MPDVIHCVYFAEPVKNGNGKAPGYGAYAMEYDVNVEPKLNGSPTCRLARELIVFDESLAQSPLRPGWLRNGVFMPSFTMDHPVIWWALRTLTGEGNSGNGLRMRLHAEKFLPPEVIHARDSLAQ